ncbi:Crp/Fnr family transcriptional regulator [Paenibacillus filicis]|uniref:Crp/Fnr family transcriptional regulator n=1 Tax=Paenibacillus filicis TaxID=669464 RepID=A0ABU9DSS7_9BACL
MKAAHIERIVSIFPCFATVSAEAWSHPDISVVHAPAAYAIHEGEMLQHAVFLLDGCVRVYKVGESGREATLYRVRSGECCVMMMSSILGEAPYEASASLETSGEALLLPVDVYRRWMDLYPPLRRLIYGMFTQRMVDVSKVLDTVLFKRVDQRIAELLLERSDARPGMLHITHETIAFELGSAREVVSRTLKEFERQGWLRVGRGRIDLLDVTALRDICSAVM